MNLKAVLVVAKLYWEYIVKKGGYPIRLQKHLKIGAISAENDDLFLSECFIDTGDYSSLVDTECDASIILGSNRFWEIGFTRDG